MSGRFFKHVSDTESESSESDEDIQPTRTQPANTAAYTFSDEEEEAKRVVKTAKEKRFEELHSIMKQIKNHKKIKDISKIVTSFENLSKAYVKAKPVIDKEEGGNVPRFYTKCLVELDTFVVDLWEDREGRKNMSKNNSKSLATLRQKLRKYNKDFETEINNYKANPDEEKEEDEESDGEGSSSSGDELVQKFGQRPGKAAETAEKDTEFNQEEVKSKFMKGSDGEEDSDEDSLWGSEDDDSTSSSDDDTKYGDNLALKFLKKDPDEQKERTRKERKVKEKRVVRKRAEEDDQEGEWEKVRGGAPVEKPKMFTKDEEITHQSVLKKMGEILAMRGKKRIHRSDQVEMLAELISLSELNNLGPAIEVKIIFGIIAALFDYNPNVSPCIKTEMWVKCLQYCNRVLDILCSNPDILTGENIAEESESYAPPSYRVHGCVLTLIERIDEEFTKLLQSVDAHSPDYIERLKDETLICSIIERLQGYLEGNQRGTSSELCRVYILRIDHIYYKFDSIVLKQKALKMKENARECNINDGFKEVEIVIDDKREDDAENELEKETSMDIMDRLCKYIYAKDTTDRIRTQAILCHIFHHSLHDNWFEARDLMLMSHLQHNIQKSDIPLQIIYNRALVQLGLCAFRHGNIKDAHTALLDIQIQGRAKELLAQGLLPRQQERTPEQEKLEKRRLLPFHKHINLELLECVYLVSAMLLEIPDVAANEYSVRKKMISRSFYNQLRKNEEQPLVGLPESMREHVVAASKAMRIGNWKTCRDFIVNDKMDGKVWNLFHQSAKVREMLVQKIREEALRAYLFTYSHIYDSISLNILSEMFDLDQGTVHSIFSKMIINEELMASLDEPTQCIIMHRTEPTRIQGLALQLADKINILVEQNERIYELKQMGHFGGGQSNRLGFPQNEQQGYRNYNQRQDRPYQDRQSNRDGQHRRGSHYTRNVKHFNLN